MFKIGEIVICKDVREYIQSLEKMDEETLEICTQPFSHYICKYVNISNLHFFQTNEDVVIKYSKNINNIPPIVVSPSFDGERIVYDGCHRCKALMKNGVEKVMALIPYKTTDNRLVEDIENNKPKEHKCKYGECNDGNCCFDCIKRFDCGGICNKCFGLDNLCLLIEKNVSLFCDGVW